MSAAQNWQDWDENDIRKQLKDCGIEASAIDRLIADDWNSGDVLPDLTLNNLTRAQFTRGQIARLTKLFVKFGIPDANLKIGATPLNPSSQQLQDSLRSGRPHLQLFPGFRSS
jgi:hypothetical protein